MKKTARNIAFAAASLAIIATLPGCSDESFFTDGEGELSMRMVLNSELTRAELGDQLYDYAGNCRLYILNSEGILHKFTGVQNLPSSLALKSGHYTAEAYSGEKVAASFDKKYYTGSSEFDITTGNRTQVVVNCRIANVAAAVDEETIDPEKMKEWKFAISNTKGSLEFTEENAAAIGYYSMPEDENNLTYTVTGKNADGAPFTKSGVISGVQPTHLYKLGVKYTEKPEDAVGGAFFSIVINDEVMLIDEVIDIYGRPDMNGIEFELDKQMNGAQGSFSDKLVRIRCFGQLKGLMLATADGDSFFHHEDGRDIAAIDLLGEFTSAENVQSMKDAGIYWTGSYDEKENITKGYLMISGAYLNSLPYRESEYRIDITATDSYGKSTSAAFRLANSEAAVVIDDPVKLEKVDQKGDLMAVGATSATITGALADANVINPVIEYKATDESTWQTTPIMVTRAGVNFTATLTDLRPGTVYQYRAGADLADGSHFSSTDVFTITTEAKYQIPNASFEDWNTYSASTMLGTKSVTIPWSVGNKEVSYWGSGNEGSATANMTLTSGSKDMAHSGQLSARLESKSAMGVIAAGNIFVGKYVKTDGTNGVLELGREYNGSHPKAVQVYANYRPGTNVSVKSGNESYIDVVKGGTDQGQVYVALTTGTVEIRTNPSNRKLFDPNGAEVIAYGQVTWKEAFGPDGQLQLLTIPLTYNSKASTVKPTHLVITAAASKFGDYFSGSVGSTIYLDDFELVY